MILFAVLRKISPPPLPPPPLENIFCVFRGYAKGRDLIITIIVVIIITKR